MPGRTGREKPWRLASTRQGLGPSGPDSEAQFAAEAATEAFLDHEFASTKQRYRRKSLEPEQWQPALLGESVWLTEPECAAAKAELFTVFERYRKDRDLLDPSRRPAGSREARLFVTVSVASPGTPAKDS